MCVIRCRAIYMMNEWMNRLFLRFIFYLRFFNFCFWMGEEEVVVAWKSDDIIVCLFVCTVVHDGCLLSMYVLNSLCRVSAKNQNPSWWCLLTQQEKRQTNAHTTPTHNSHPKSTLPRSCYYSTSSLACLYRSQSASFLLAQWVFFPPFSLFIFPWQEISTWIPQISLAL